MSSRFYIAWTTAVLLAVIVPIAVPLVLWPPAYYDDALIGDCAGIAKDYIADHPIETMYPVSVDVQRCAGTPGSPVWQIEAQVEARGPYGIPFASGSVSRSDISYFDEHGDAYLGLAALLGGVVAVSLPFVGVLVRQRAVRRVAFAV